MEKTVEKLVIDQGVTTTITIIFLGVIVYCLFLALKHFPGYIEKQNELKERQIEATVNQTHLLQDYLKILNDNNEFMAARHKDAEVTIQQLEINKLEMEKLTKIIDDLKKQVQEAHDPSDKYKLNQILLLVEGIYREVVGAEGQQ